jgi:hypothetical protein
MSFLELHSKLKGLRPEPRTPSLVLKRKQKHCWKDVVCSWLPGARAITLNKRC